MEMISWLNGDVRSAAGHARETFRSVPQRNAQTLLQLETHLRKLKTEVCDIIVRGRLR